MLIGLISTNWQPIFVILNILISVLIRNELFLISLYRVVTSTPHWTYLRLRHLLANSLFHIGGIHSGCGVSSLIWLMYLCLSITTSHSISIVMIGYGLLFLTFLVVVTAIHPTFRNRFHNVFEKIHRFAGWTILIFTWIFVILLINENKTDPINNPVLWLLVVITISIFTPWAMISKVPIAANVISNHVIILNLKVKNRKPGTFIRISKSPWGEWHSFATIFFPNQEELCLIVSNNGDWTKCLIENVPQYLWIRPICSPGFMATLPMFKKVVCIATGAGIAPVISHLKNCDNIYVIWFVKKPSITFGEKLYKIISELPNQAIYDTSLMITRLDPLPIVINTYDNFVAEAVFVISNPGLTQKIVYGCESRKICAFGAIWDS